MNKITSLIVIGLAFALGAMAEEVTPIVKGATGTASATIYIESASATLCKITDVAAKLDTGNVSATLNIRTGRKRFAVTSATSSSAVVYFDNSGSTVAAEGFILHDDTSAGTLTLYKITSATTTSATSYSTITGNPTTSDYVWSLNTMVSRPIGDSSVSGTQAFGVMYLPTKEPTAITLDGNTTSCKLSVSGVRQR